MFDSKQVGGVSLTRISPLIARHIEVGAQRPPHVPGVHAGLDGLHGGTPAESGQYMIDQQRGATHRTELHLDQFMELGQPHDTKLPSLNRPVPRGTSPP